MRLYCNESWLLPVIFFSCYTLVSCKKDDGPGSLQSGTYISDNAGDFSSVRLFAKSGEIKDQHLIDAYKTNFAQLLTPADGVSFGLDTFFVIDENNVKYGPRNFAVSPMDNCYQFRSDTVKYVGQVDDLIVNIGKYKPFYINFPLPLMLGGNSITTFQYYYASSASNDLVFPMINMIRFSTTMYTGGFPSGSFYNAYTINNRFDDKFPLNTLNRDTLLVQTYNVYYKK